MDIGQPKKNPNLTEFVWTQYPLYGLNTLYQTEEISFSMLLHGASVYGGIQVLHKGRKDNPVCCYYRLEYNLSIFLHAKF